MSARYLLDTNIFLFRIINEEMLDKNVFGILDDYENLLYVSSESVKEVLHLWQCGKVSFARWKTAADIFASIDDLRLTVKYVQPEHLLTFGALPLVKDHHDPSDRLIIAQGITEKMTTVSSDNKFPLYRRYGLKLIYNRR
ncbi:twitching motility protein PilT [Planctomycetales bacterium]|nr:twitching motility protein PilT [Planctomycetales bacterium]GHS96655.1 twitching motility protein PilT [Planctomycetales bacterium]GHT05150.1 twitching motility protein PilT [Planctomycetales bacterium]